MIEEEKKIRSIRASQAAFDRFAEISKEARLDQGATFEALINAWDNQQVNEDTFSERTIIKRERKVSLARNTKETQIQLTLNLDGVGRGEIATGCGFLNHMLELFTRHGDFDITLTCHGDTEVDYHHTAEDIGIVLGQAFTKALGDKRGIVRYGQFLLPMDETLVLCAVDLSGRDCLVWAVDLPSAKVGDFDTELAKEFWLGFVRNCPCALHIRQMSGENTHHILEAVFKGAARALRMAVDFDPRHRDEIPSTKGVL